MAKSRSSPAGPGEDEERGSWHLRSAGAWTFALALWLAGVGGIALFAQDGVDIGWARWRGVAGTVTIQDCAHTRSYALCYGPFDAADGSVHRKRVELRTFSHDTPARQERTWLRTPTATHTWGSDVNPWAELIPVAPFALLALVQTVWMTASWRAWRRRRQPRPQAPIAAKITGPAPVDAGLGLFAPPAAAAHPDPGLFPPEPARQYPPPPEPYRRPARPSAPPASAYPAPPGAYPPAGESRPPASGPRPPAGESRPPARPRPAGSGRVYRSDRAWADPVGPEGEPDGLGSPPAGEGQAPDGWQDRRGTAVPPGPASPQPRARRAPWERPEHG